MFNVLILCLFAQNTPIVTMELSNGMKVVMCEDHAQPQIYGAVCVHAGSKNDPADNTGMAHYLEHLMFKGTDRIGTLDWASEKVYLDSISMLYDELHGETDVKRRSDILLHINDLNNKATQYAIPNEVDVILDKMGGKGVNAFTSNDVTVYHNGFPSNQLEKWLTVYAERFRNPVFRLFQSELEAVYEEYNMYQDEPMMTFMEDALTEAFGDHPYGRPVIGYPQHLKNPQLSAMQEFFNTYYHPANMTLVLVGDFDAHGIRELLERTMGHLRNQAEGVDFRLSISRERMHTELNQKVQPFENHQIVTVKETPVKMGVIGFRTVGTQHLDAFYLDILSRLLSNESSTGLLDQLMNEHKLLYSMGINYSMTEEGIFGMLYVPKILGQSHEQAESLVFSAIENLKTGNFSDDLFEAVKMEYLTEYLTEMESMEDKFDVILGLVTDNQPVEWYEKKAELIRNLTKDLLVDVAQRYFTDNCLIFRSNMGIKKHEKLQKPGWSPVVAKNTEKKSLFAQSIEEMPVEKIHAQTVDFGKTISQMPISDNYVLYSSENPCNDIFTLNIYYNYGTMSDVRLESAVDYVDLLGTQRLRFDEFQLAMQKLGASMMVDCTSDVTTVSISGFDKDLPEILQLCREKLQFPENDESKLELLVDEEAQTRKMQKGDASAWGQALFYYVIYGENSPFLRKMNLKELKKVSGKELLSSFAEIFNYNGYVTYVGNRNAEEVARLMTDAYGLKREVKEGTREIAPLQKYKQPTIFVVSNKQFLQSNIYFYKLGQRVTGMKNQVMSQAYNEYMNGSMAGIIFQEIRELRSLGYSAAGGYRYDWLNRRPGFLMGYLGTQSDKTVEGCVAMSDLLASFPRREEKFAVAIESAVAQKSASYVNFRDIPRQVRVWQMEGYDHDPRAEMLQLMQTLSIDDVDSFYREMVGGSPLIITVAGDKKRMDINKLGKDFQIIEVKCGDIMR